MVLQPISPLSTTVTGVAATRPVRELGTPSETNTPTQIVQGPVFANQAVVVQFGPQALQLARNAATANDTATLNDTAPNVFNTDEANAALRPATADLTGPLLATVLGQNETNAALLSTLGPNA